MLANYFTVMNNNMAEEDPLCNGIQNITSLGYEKVRDRDDDGGFCDGLKRQGSELSNGSSSSSMSSGQHVQMKKGVGLMSGVALIVGTMIGK